jgi:hypothetical protein
MLKLIIAVMAMAGTTGIASAQTYYIRQTLTASGFDKAAEPVDDHVYRWTQPIDFSASKLCVAGFKTTPYLNQCYDQTAGVVVEDAKCPSPAPAARTDVFACTLNCSTLRASRMPPTPGTFIGTATSSTGAQALCNKQTAQNGICYRDTTTNNVTFGYAAASTLVTSSKATDTAIYCGASPDLMPLPAQ